MTVDAGPTVVGTIPDSPLTQPFWSAAARGELVRPVCQRCGRSFFVPQVACPHCLAEEWEYLPSTGRGTVYSHTTVHRPPVPAFASPYVLAIVDVEEGWSLLTRLLEPVPAGRVIGLLAMVEFTPDPVTPTRWLPTFRAQPSTPTR